jgi:tRNA-Thr(GGU) m(6)t(6)A37 methyltransferase TsaA
MTKENDISLTVKPIGVIHSSLTEAKGSPIQPIFARDSEGVVEVYEPYRQGLKDLEGFERIWLIYWFHKAAKYKPLVTPYLDTVERGLFATRAPCRPNPIGMSSVRSSKIKDGRIYIAEVDILDGTPLLDIKPYVSRFDNIKVERNGWQDHASGMPGIADKRFHNENKTGD